MPTHCGRIRASARSSDAQEGARRNLFNEVVSTRFATIRPEVAYGEVRAICVQERRVHDAPEEERDAEERLRAESDKSQAGDRDWPQRGEKEGRQGSVAAEGGRKEEVAQ